ncbi:hypothetical protein BH09PAT2_BH09PAT2_10020 [soil metagenome]
MANERLTRLPGFDPQKAAECGNLLCGTGNGALSEDQRMCIYMEQTNPLNDGSVTAAQLADPDGDWAGWLKDACPFGEIVYEERTKN